MIRTPQNTVAAVALTALSSAHTIQTVSAGHHQLHRIDKNNAAVAASPVHGEKPLNGSVWPTAIYWTTISVGTPPVEIPVAVDGGSSTLTVTVKGCDGCVTAPPNVPYNPDVSNTSKNLQKPWSVSYETCVPQNPAEACTISGNRYTDEVSFKDINGNVLGPVNMLVSAISYQTKNFYQLQEIDGIAGFFPDHDTGDCPFEQICLANAKCGRNWGMCINNEGSTSTGTLTIGTIDEELADGPIHWYYIGEEYRSHQKVTNITVNGHSVGPGPFDTILDTGTNNVLVPENVLKPMLEEMCKDKSLKHCSDINASASALSCFGDLTEADIAAYPPVEFNLPLDMNGAPFKLVLQPQDLWLKGSPAAPEKHCFGVGNAPFFIIGDTLMRHYYNVYDYGYNGKNQRIGWGNVNLNRCGHL